MSNPQDWMINLPTKEPVFGPGSIRQIADWEKQRPGETQDEYYRRTGKGFFLPTPPPGSKGQIGDTEVELNPIPKKGEGPSVSPTSADFPTPLIDWLKERKVQNPDAPNDPVATIAPAGEQVDLLAFLGASPDFPDVERGTSDDPSVYYNGTEALDKLVEVFGLQNTITWCRMTAMKYSLRMGKKAGNSVEQEAGKISWYLAAAEKLSLQL